MFAEECFYEATFKFQMIDNKLVKLTFVNFNIKLKKEARFVIIFSYII